MNIGIDYWRSYKENYGESSTEVINVSILQEKDNNKERKWNEHQKPIGRNWKEGLFRMIKDWEKTICLIRGWKRKDKAAMRGKVKNDAVEAKSQMSKVTSLKVENQYL